MHFFRETWTSNVWTTMTMMTISKLSQHNQFPTRSANRSRVDSKAATGAPSVYIRLLKAVYSLVNAPRRWYHRVATDPRNMRGEESLMETLLVDLPRRERSFMLCVWYMLMTSCWRAVTLHLENMSLIASTICVNGELWSQECTHSAAHESHKPMTNTPEDGGG